MAMEVPVGTKLGQVDNLGALDALFKTTFSGLVVREFEANRFVSKMLRHKWAIRGSKARDFRLMGAATARFHKRGESIKHTGVGGDTSPTGDEAGGYLSEIPQAVRDIKLSDCLLAATVVDELEELKNEFDAKRDLASELGIALADKDELYSLMALIKAANLPDAYTGEPAAGGTEDITGWAALTDQQKMDNLYTACYTAKEAFDLRKVSARDRILVIAPSYQRFFTENTNIVHRDYGGMGSIAEGTAPMLAGWKIVYNHNFPTTDLSTQPSAEKNLLHADFSDHIGVFFTPDAGGRVSAKEMINNIYWDEDIHQYVLKSRMIVGHGPVRRECARVLKKTDL